MQKKKSDRKVRLGMRCGDCIHYLRAKHDKFEDVCCKLGVRDKASAPDCYSPDIYRVATVKNPEILGELGRMLKDLRPSQLRIIAFTLTRGSNLIERHKLKFGQPVYFSLGKDYLAHYFKGYVIGATAENVIVTSTLKKSKSNTVGQFLPETLFTAKKFKKKKEELIAKNRLVMSEDEKRFTKLPLPELMDDEGRVPHVEQEIFEYDPPTLDTAPQEWFDKSQKKAKKKKSKDGYIPIVNIEDIPSKKSKSSGSGAIFKEDGGFVHSTRKARKSMK